MKFITHSLLAATLSALAVVPAAAEPVQVTVNYGDLNLNSSAGADKLAQRIETQVQSACERPDIREMRAMQNYTSCLASAQSVTAETLARIGVRAN